MSYSFVDGVSCGQWLEVKEITPTNAINIYPNPATTYLTISASARITSIIISNLFGQPVYSNQYNSKTLQVDVAKLPNGIYFVKVNGVDVWKFVKQ